MLGTAIEGVVSIVVNSQVLMCGEDFVQPRTISSLNGTTGIDHYEPLVVNHY